MGSFGADSIRHLELRTDAPRIAKVCAEVIRRGLLIAREKSSGELRWRSGFERGERIEEERSETIRDESYLAPLLVKKAA